MKRSKGARSRTRALFKTPCRQKGKVKITEILKSFNIDDKVLIKPNPSFTESIPHRRFYGKTGMVKDKRGKCYIISVMDGKLEKTLMVPPVHLRLQK